MAFFVVFPVLILLGFWQLDRADEKRQIESDVNSATDKPALVINKAISDLRREVYRKAIITGNFDSGRQFLWDNKTHQGKPGFHVLTPFLIDDQENTAVIVNRGWVPMLGRRDQLPDVSVELATITISGVIKDPSNAIQLADRQDLSGTKFPHIVQAFEPDAFGAELGLTFLPVMIELAKDDEYGYVRDWKPYFGRIDRHNGYALQWFLMALITLFLFVKLNTKRADIE